MEGPLALPVFLSLALGSMLITKSLLRKYPPPFTVYPVHPASQHLTSLPWPPEAKDHRGKSPRRTVCCHSIVIIDFSGGMLSSQKSQSSFLSSPEVLHLEACFSEPPASSLTLTSFHGENRQNWPQPATSYLCLYLCLLLSHCPFFLLRGEEMSTSLGRWFLPLMLWIPSEGDLVSAPL